MRKIITITFVTLDGVLQGPGSPQEDSEDGFTQGGWTAPYGDELEGELIANTVKNPFELLMGRKTYDIWASFWPHTEVAQHIAKPYNATTKYVVSHDNLKLAWQNSVLVTGDVVSELQKLKEMDAPDLWVWGSGNLVQTLLKADLVDRMHIWTYPVTVGEGKRLFAGGSIPAAFKLTEGKISSTGVIFATYERAGELKTGTPS